ncbi:MAG: TolC family protein [Acidobacteria bacterium]|nr:TolC family protein [Acidobacteriota bacterium]
MIRYFCLGLCLAGGASAQTALTWQQVVEKFRAANPNLMAGQLGIQESKAAEVTAYLRPNPTASVTLDQLQIFNGNPYRPLTNALPIIALDYVHERQHKRELRLQSAQQGTAIAESQQQDLERNLLFSLRTAFVQTLQAKALLANAKENLAYFDKELLINRDRYRSGDIARVDLDRIVLQRVQYDSDYQTALVNARTAKIVLLMLLNDRTPVDRFDVDGPFTFQEKLQPLEEFHAMALDSRPDLRAAVQAVAKATTDHKLAVANGSTDPDISIDFGHTGADSFVGGGVSIPLRIFDRNQGEKARTRIDITRAERQRDATQAQAFSDVDSAYFILLSTASQLRPYTGDDGYLKTASRIRDTMSFSYQKGQAALVDYLDAQRDYRATEVAYTNLVGAYLTAAGQLNMAVGREVIP